jgi:Mlc titration factor MtfA (ptsG expression regulator)
VTIAAQACVLLLGRKLWSFTRLPAILVYPRTYVVPEEVHIPGGTLVQPVERAGESWRYGEVVIAWDEVNQGPEDFCDGYNVVLHEFAHQLDQEDGWVDGVPDLGDRESCRTWTRVLRKHYEELREVAEGDGEDDGVLDSYGATNQAEFFAVATEAFFETPQELQEDAPDLYDVLRGYYKLDPAQWE